ncbi:MAG: saccharopine dehydrogenase NADP-binding domain-containing protein [Chloroflexi bacterium]|nr:saccharopine dehydrogenase NADP-binding domain-containing protein [Chloroflexota bacterium]
MRVLVLGGAGAMGWVAADILAREGDVDEVAVADLEIDRAQRVVERFPAGVGRALKVDVNDGPALVRAMRGAQVVANCVWYPLNLQVMRATLQAGVHYADLGGLYHMTRRQFEMDSDFRAAGLTAILGIGASPGVTNLMAKYAAQQLDRVDEVYIYSGTRALDGEERTSFTFSARTMLDEILLRPVIYRDGEYIEVEPLSGEELINLPEPVGPMKGHLTLHSEVATLPITLQVRRAVEVRICWSDALVSRLKFLEELGLTSPEPIDFNGARIAPRQFLDRFLPQPLMGPSGKNLVGAMLTIVRGEKESRPMEHRLTTLRREDPQHGYSLVGKGTGLPLAIACRMLGSGRVAGPGVLAPESGLDPVEFFKELTRHGQAVEVATKAVIV